MLSRKLRIMKHMLKFWILHHSQSQRFTLSHNLPQQIFSQFMSDTQTTERILKINSQGAITSLRQQLDGKTYFGCKENMDGTIVNDVILEDINTILIEKYTGRHFKIEYDLQNYCYTIKDLGRGFGVFTQIQSSVFIFQIVQQNFMFNIGLNFLVILFSESQMENPQDRMSKDNSFNNDSICQLIKLRFFGGPMNGKEFEFDASQKQLITIGRKDYCDIHIKHRLLSEKQCYLQYQSKSGWVLIDGSPEGRPSTNGTWQTHHPYLSQFQRLYLRNEQPIRNMQFFKVNQTIIQAKIINNDDSSTEKQQESFILEK